MEGQISTTPAPGGGSGGWLARCAACVWQVTAAAVARRHDLERALRSHEATCANLKTVRPPTVGAKTTRHQGYCSKCQKGFDGSDRRVVLALLKEHDTQGPCLGGLAKTTAKALTGAFRAPQVGRVVVGSEWPTASGYVFKITNMVGRHGSSDPHERLITIEGMMLGPGTTHVLELNINLLGALANNQDPTQYAQQVMESVIKKQCAANFGHDYTPVIVKKKWVKKAKPRPVRKGKYTWAPDEVESQQAKRAALDGARVRFLEALEHRRLFRIVVNELRKQRLAEEVPPGAITPEILEDGIRRMHEQQAQRPSYTVSPSLYRELEKMMQTRLGESVRTPAIDALEVQTLKPHELDEIAKHIATPTHEISSEEMHDRVRRQMYIGSGKKFEKL